MKKNVILFLTIAWAFQSFSQNADSIYYYRENGEKEWWYIQKDMFSFRLQNGLEYTNPETDFDVVDSVYHKNNSTRKLNILEFKENSNDGEREIEKNKPRNRPNFECEFLVLTKDKFASKSEYKWKTSDDIVLVVFRDPGISNSDIAQFMNRNDLVPHHTPGNNLPSQVSWTHAFRIRPDKCGQVSSIQKAKEIFENENALVKICSPNLKVYDSHCEVIQSNTEVYSENNKMWWLENTGEEIINGQTGENDADVDLCECWEAGYTGNGIKIAVIDTRGFEFDHEDMEGVFIGGWNAIDNSQLNNGDYGDGYENAAHGMFVSGLIGANLNTIGIVGAAYNSKIYPVLMDGEIVHAVIGVQKAVENQCDIINMSFGLNYGAENYTEEDEAFLKNEIYNAANFGRYKEEHNTFYGSVIVASTGNDGRNFLEPGQTDIGYHPGYKQAPAYYDEVIGVGHSNMYDKHLFLRTLQAGIIETVGRHNGGPSYEVVAPGSLMFSTDLLGQNGYSAGNYSISQVFPLSLNRFGTSFSAPLVSGICAILLEKNPYQSRQEIRSKLINGTDRIHPELYDYNYYPEFPGVSNQMYYGRVNCLKSLNLVEGVNGVNELLRNNIHIFEESLINSSEYELQFQIMDITGKIIDEGFIKPNQAIDLGLTSGIYLLKIFDPVKLTYSALKFLIQN